MHFREFARISGTGESDFSGGRILLLSSGSAGIKLSLACKYESTVTAKNKR